MLPTPTPQASHLAENVMHFARVLRAAGLPVGSDRVQLALQALQMAGLERRGDFHAVLLACMLSRNEHRLLFDQAFALFWRNPDLMGRMHALLLPKVEAKSDLRPPMQENRRLAAALFGTPAPRPHITPPAPQEWQIDATLSYSAREVLRKTDFETMSTAEWQQARRLLYRLPLLLATQRTRRWHKAQHAGRVDWRATLSTMARRGGDLGAMRWQQPASRPAPLILLTDISGSMSRYSRVLLHFAHALGQAQARVESFVFGTRLTRTTRLLHGRDPDHAIHQVVQAVQDWSGGTRISACVRTFNRHWARRLPCANANLLLVCDGLEHGDTSALAFEMERLHKSCHRLIWLNPLLRFDAFEPRAAGIRAMLPHVDLFLPAHNLASLEELVKILTQTRTPSWN